MQRNASLLPFLAALLGVALFSAMDGLMKAASLAIGVYAALLLRNLIGSALMIPTWLALGGRWPQPRILRLHILRGIVSALTGLTFFYALTLLPLAEAIALSFVAPLVALYLAAVLLGEKVSRAAILASLLGLVGVGVIALGRLDRSTSEQDSLMGILAVLTSAILYAWNLVLQRQQALVANPREVASFMQGVAAIAMLLGAPWLGAIPDTTAVWLSIAGASLLTVLALIVLSWAYARAETQALIPLEYSAFGWAALFGWLMFGEKVTLTTLGGTVLIVASCWIAAPRRRTEACAA